MYFYSGTPGSGKSLQVAKDIIKKLKINRQNVIANFEINREYVYKNKKKKKKYGTFYHISNDKLTVDFLVQYAKKFHTMGVENQTLLVIDEAQMLFSPTVVKLRCKEDSEYRVKWLEFFTQHRKLGYNIILISQFDRLIDAQIRCLFEYNVIHRKANNFGPGQLLSLFGISLFSAVHYWYGVNERTGVEFYCYKKKYSKIYNSYTMFK